MRILVSKRRALGDTVLLSSTIAMIKQRFPASEITVMVPEAFAPVLEGNPNISELWTWEEDSSLSRFWRIWRKGFDLYFRLHARPDWWWRVVFYRLIVKKIFAHVQNKETEKNYGKHPNALEWDSFFLQKTMGDSVRVPAPQPRIYLRTEEHAWAKDFLRRRGIEGKNAVFLGLGASRSTKRWSPDLVARFAELMRDRLGFSLVIVTGPSEADQEFSGEVLDRLRVKGFRPQVKPGDNGGILFETDFTVRQLAAILSEVRVYVGNDSGPKHLAVAVDTPTVTIFGPEDPREWHPYDLLQHPVFFLEGLSCRMEDNGRWCGIEECTTERHRCMTGIDPLDVFHATERLVVAEA